MCGFEPRRLRHSNSLVSAEKKHGRNKNLLPDAPARLTSASELQHKHPCDFVDRLTVCRREPVDDIEPDETENLVREAQRRFAFLMDRYARFITRSENARLAAWQGAFAIGLPCCEGMGYADVAKMCGVGLLSLGDGRAAVSKGAMWFCEANDLKPSPYMKREEARPRYKKARSDSINDNAAA